MTDSRRLMGIKPTSLEPTLCFVTSWLLSPTLLASIRFLVALYCFVVIFFIWGWQGTRGNTSAIRTSFSYFTDLTFWGIAFYNLFAALHTFSYARTGRALLGRWPVSLQILHSLLYTTIVTFPFLVTVVFWALLFQATLFSDRFFTWSNVSQHGLNSLFAVVELILPATDPPPWLHLLFLIVILALYLALAYITHATEGFYVYSFLNPAEGRGKLTGYVFGILAAAIIIFLIIWVVIWVRRRFTRPGKRSKWDVVRSDRDQDVELVQQPK